MGGGASKAGQYEHEKEMQERAMGQEKSFFERQLKEGAEARQRGMELSDEAYGQFQDIYSQPSQALAGMERAITEGSLPGQQRAQQFAKTALEQQNVRGPQAALELSRQAGMQGQNLDKVLADLRLTDEKERRSQKGKLAGERALMGATRYLS